MRDYGPTIDDAYEEDLKASVGKLLLRLDGTLVKTFDDTPAGREHCYKAGFELDRKNPGRVTVDRMGAGGLAVSHAPKESRREGTSRPVPASIRPTEGCCVPTPGPGPSGVRKRHARDCPEEPGGVWREPVRREPTVGHLQRRLAAETARTGLDEVIRQTPHAGVLTALTDRCPVHPKYLWWECPEYDERTDR